MSHVDVHSLSILARTHLLKSALEQIASELQLPFYTIEDANSVQPISKVVLLSFTNEEGLLEDIDILLNRLTAPRIVLFPLDPSLLQSLSSLPNEVAAVVSPDMLASEIKSVISLVVEGHRIISYSTKADHHDPLTSHPQSGRLKLLTERQLEILQQVAQGQSNKSIARTLDISVNTVEAHVSKVIRKLKVVNRTQAALALSGVTDELPHKRRNTDDYERPSTPRVSQFRTITGGVSTAAAKTTSLKI
ncbi:response regulator transcription factor [Thalassobius sp. Cn5-15]|uniref:response regulator transcription factor n=1 Tax=Thalassobius sp. Cn5-15 TaxID=2917763 RepID=UPI001EF1A99B|nr:LuxR C-terminal-related transcriptional regulator [Thalassobius sp. Cn5-15]MCG7493172.1 LuxR C-terminal-related transcriptional regulator [Thalassobius sp. Cn5-15]